MKRRRDQIKDSETHQVIYIVNEDENMKRGRGGGEMEPSRCQFHTSHVAAFDLPPLSLSLSLLITLILLLALFAFYLSDCIFPLRSCASSLLIWSSFFNFSSSLPLSFNYCLPLSIHSCFSPVRQSVNWCFSSWRKTFTQFCVSPSLLLTNHKPSLHSLFYHLRKLLPHPMTTICGSLFQASLHGMSPLCFTKINMTSHKHACLFVGI